MTKSDLLPTWKERKLFSSWSYFKRPFFFRLEAEHVDVTCGKCESNNHSLFPVWNIDKDCDLIRTNEYYLKILETTGGTLLLGKHQWLLSVENDQQTNVKQKTEVGAGEKLQ